MPSNISAMCLNCMFQFVYQWNSIALVEMFAKENAQLGHRLRTVDGSERCWMLEDAQAIIIYKFTW